MRVKDLLEELIDEVRRTRMAIERAGVPVAAEMGRQAQRLVSDKVALKANNREIMKRCREKVKGGRL